MQRPQVFFPLCLSLLFLASSGTANGDSTCALRLESISLQTGLRGGHVPHGSLSDFRDLAPDNELLKRDLSNYESSNNINDVSSYPLLFLRSSFKIKDDEGGYHERIRWRIGASAHFTDDLNGSLYEDPRGGNAASQRSVSMDYSGLQLFLRSSLVKSTDPNARFRFYGGGGLAAGGLLSPSTTVHDQRGAEIHYEESRNNPAFTAAAYIPLGAEFTLGSEKTFWEPFAVFIEMRPDLKVTTIPEIDPVLSTNMAGSIGLEYELR